MNKTIYCFVGVKNYFISIVAIILIISTLPSVTYASFVSGEDYEAKLYGITPGSGFGSELDVTFEVGQLDGNNPTQLNSCNISYGGVFYSCNPFGSINAKTHVSDQSYATNDLVFIESPPTYTGLNDFNVTLGFNFLFDCNCYSYAKVYYDDPSGSVVFYFAGQAPQSLPSPDTAILIGISIFGIRFFQPVKVRNPKISTRL